MRRWIAIIATISAVFMSVSSVAAYDGEITFRDIPWGSDMDTVTYYLPECVMVDMGLETDDSLSSRGILLDYSRSEKYEPGVGKDSMSFMVEDLNVAGYTVDCIYLYFACLYDDGNIDYDNCGTYFYGATYKLEFVDFESACADLESKLTSLYGDIDEEYTDHLVGGPKYSKVWNGANGTAVSLQMTDFDEDDDISINYVSSSGDEILKKNSDMIAGRNKVGESSVYGNGDNSGL